MGNGSTAIAGQCGYPPKEADFSIFDQLPAAIRNIIRYGHVLYDAASFEELYRAGKRRGIPDDLIARRLAKQVDAELVRDCIAAYGYDHPQAESAKRSIDEPESL